MADLTNMDLGKLIKHYSEDANCRELLKELRWPDGVECPRCGCTSISRISTRDQYDCNECRYRFSVTAGTIFDNTNLPLWKWFVAIYMMLESKKGVSAAQIARTIDVSYPTAWHLCHRIRDAIDEDGDGEFPLLSGIVEVDETWVGGKKKGVGRGSMEGKTMVAGIMERDGDARMDVEEGRDRATLHSFIRRYLADDAEAVYTDDWSAYDGIEDENTVHEVVNHSAEEWVRGEIHTNGVEGLWSLLQRSIVGAYHHVSVKHLEAYLDELEWRFNNRENEHVFRDTLLRLVGAKPLRFHSLTG